MQRPWIVIIAGMLSCGGCGGYYTLTAGDHLAAVGGDTPVVVRLQRNDFFFLNLGAKDAVMRFRIGEGVERAAYTDKLGYAGTTVAAPVRAGRYTLTVDHMDSEGEEVGVEVPLFVWDPKRAVVAVDADGLPPADSKDAALARSALARWSRRANIVYFTRRAMREHPEMHEQLKAAGCPDGPILLWQRERWHVVRDGRFNLPRVVVESRLVSRLPELRKSFPKLSSGLCGSAMPARAFAAAGMTAIVVGKTEVDGTKIIRRDSWKDVAQAGL